MNGCNKKCNLCCSEVETFFPFGVDIEFFKNHHIIGGGYREGCICPVCGSMDRNRFVYYCLNRETGIFKTRCRVLHFAPEKPISEKIRGNKECWYITANIEKNDCDIAVDMTDIPFKDGIFDYVIANHVLEHILDEEAAIKELVRVTSANGKIILSFPICTDMDTYEDASIISSEGRLRAFGQEDHVRIYGKDYKERLQKYGIVVHTYSPSDFFDKDEIKQNGFIFDDVLLMCKK